MVYQVHSSLESHIDLSHSPRKVLLIEWFTLKIDLIFVVVIFLWAHINISQNHLNSLTFIHSKSHCYTSKMHVLSKVNNQRSNQRLLMFGLFPRICCSHFYFDVNFFWLFVLSLSF